MYYLHNHLFYNKSDDIQCFICKQNIHYIYTIQNIETSEKKFIGYKCALGFCKDESKFNQMTKSFKDVKKLAEKYTIDCDGLDIDLIQKQIKSQSLWMSFMRKFNKSFNIFV